MRSCAALAAVVLACICLAGTAGAAQPAPSAAAPLTLVLETPRLPVVWGDTVHCSGSGTGSGVVAVLVDGVEAGRCAPDSDGVYRFDYRIDHVAAGAHVISADDGSGATAEASLDVASSVPVIRLDAVPSVWENSSALLCTGNVTASGRGVPDAPVHLVFDNYGWTDAVTGAEGQFEVNAGVPGGRHQVVANVSFADGRPLGPASSNVVGPVVSGGPVLPPWVLPGIAVLALLLLAGGYLIRRRSRGVTGQPPAGDVDLTALFQPGSTATAGPSASPPAPPPDETAAAVSPAPPEAATAPPASGPAAVNGANGELRAAAWALAGNGMRCGIGAVYGDLVARLGAREPEAHLERMTPRQLAAHFAGTPAEAPVARVASCYEAVTSTWRPPTPADLETMVEGYMAALAASRPPGP